MNATQIERNWTEVGAEYTGPGPDRECVEQEIAALEWRPIPESGSLELAMSPGLAIKTAIEELRLPRVSAVAVNGYITWPDGPETAHYSIYGIEANYRDGPVRVYALDTGTALVPLASEEV